MIPILQVKDENGNWVSIPSIVGPRGQQGIPGTAAQVRINQETKMWEYANEYDEQGEPIWVSSDLKAVGDIGPQGIPGESGVYVGEEEPGQEYKVWIDYDETDDGIVKSVNGITPDANGNVEIEVVNHETPRIETSEATITLEPNKYYIFPEMATLDITLGGELDSSILQEYSFRFTSGATATILTLPEDIKGDITVNANSVVELSIVDGYAVSQSWAVSE